MGTEVVGGVAAPTLAIAAFIASEFILPGFVGIPRVPMVFMGFIGESIGGGILFFTGVFLPGVGVMLIVEATDDAVLDDIETFTGGGGGAPLVGKGAKVFIGVVIEPRPFTFFFFCFGVSIGAGVILTGPGPNITGPGLLTTGGGGGGVDVVGGGACLITTGGGGGIVAATLNG